MTPSSQTSESPAIPGRFRATLLRVTFDQLVSVMEFEGSFQVVAPLGESTEFTFSGGYVGSGEQLAVSWEPEDAIISSLEWYSVAGQTGGLALFGRFPFLAGVVTSLVAAILFFLAIRSPRAMRILLRSINRDLAFGKRLRTSGVSNFYTSRNDYATYRKAPRLSDYLDTARNTIEIAALWMAHGTEMEDEASHIAGLAKRGKLITIAVFDFSSSSCDAFAEHMGMDPDEVKRRIQTSLQKLWQARETLSDAEKARLRILVYDSIPIASVIMLDADDPLGRIQLDFKPFHAPRQDSFAFEVRGNETHLYTVVKRAWRELLLSATEFDPATIP